MAVVTVVTSESRLAVHPVHAKAAGSVRWAWWCSVRGWVGWSWGSFPISEFWDAVIVADGVW